MGISPVAFWTAGRPSPESLAIVARLVEQGFVPVIHGDAILDPEASASERPRGPATTKSRILSGDTIVRDLALSLKPRVVLFLSNVQGIYDRPPEKPGARLVKRIRVARADSDNDNGNGEGGGGGFTLAFDDGEGASGCAGGGLEFAAQAHDSTGGMETKVREAASIARHGFDVLVTRAGSEAAITALRDHPNCLNPGEGWEGTAVVQK